MILETILNDYVEGYGRKVSREDNPLSGDGYKSMFFTYHRHDNHRRFLNFSLWNKVEEYKIRFGLDEYAYIFDILGEFSQTIIKLDQVYYNRIYDLTFSVMKLICPIKNIYNLK